MSLITVSDKSKQNVSDSCGISPSKSVHNHNLYLPPFKSDKPIKKVQDKTSPEYQRLTWDSLRNRITRIINKVTPTNLEDIIREFFDVNLIRGRGIFCRSVLTLQMSYPEISDVLSALVAVVNSLFSDVGQLFVRRIVWQFKRAYKRNDKPQLLNTVKFIAHFVNQQVAHEIIAIEILTVLLDKPNDDNIEVAVHFVIECGSMLQDVSPRVLYCVFEFFRGILDEGMIDKRVRFLIERLFSIRKARFQGYPAVRPELDLVKEEDVLTHEVSVHEDIDPEFSLDVFKLDPYFAMSEKLYEVLKKNLLDDEESEEDQESDSDEESDEDKESMQIKDETNTNVSNLRRTIYLTIMSCLDFEEAGHKLLKIHLEQGQEMELCIILLECCSQEKTYREYYGLLGQRLCMINKVYQENFEKCFAQQFAMVHKLETSKRNVAEFFAHLLSTFALPWNVLSYIRLSEEDTTSSSRIFIKILFQELSKHLGIQVLNERLNDPKMQDCFESIFPKDNARNIRFCINFFTSIGLGGLAEYLRDYLKRSLIKQQQEKVSDSDTRSSHSSDSSGPATSDENGRKRKRN
ncbi:hypothetical protein TSUD_332720 [Trifolium subterraneum]|uniref:MI domain-containing protein n=1 Tax=Trifolium subterraneum TaxID=3900 RepID=A0A2Z6NNN2_TRISU|nr:hypothetical protein TSUD_332720 [Trifolium subterraneum]